MKAVRYYTDTTNVRFGTIIAISTLNEKDQFKRFWKKWAVAEIQGDDKYPTYNESVGPVVQSI